MKPPLRNEPSSSFFLRFYVIFVLSLFLSQGFIHAQDFHGGCASDVVRKEMSLKDPSLFDKERQSNERISKLINAKSNMRLEAAPVCKIPVVFHIISPSADMNAFMTEAELEIKVTNTLTWLNAAFSGQSPYAGVNTNVQFVRAQQTKNFLFTPGYTRGNHVLSNLNSPSAPLITTDDQLINYIIGQNGGTLANYFYPSDRYLNVIIVNDLNGPGGVTPAGYAYLPFGSSVLEDAIVVKKQFFGNSPEENVVMIHEVGHYLGLYHTFQNCLNGVCPAAEVLTCVNNDCTKDGDMVCDTPPDATNSPSSSCTPSSSCNTDATVDPGGINKFTYDAFDLVENYMDYGSAICKNAFTQGQADRMTRYITDSRQALCNSIGTQSLCSKPLLSFDFSIVPTNNQFLITPSLVFANTADTKLGYYYEVNFGDGTAITTYDANTTPSFSHAFPSASTYFVTVTLQYKATGASSYSAECKRIVTKSATTTCPNAPTFTVSKTTVALGEIVTFTNTTVCPAGNTCTYRWLVNGSVVASNTISFPLAGVQMVQLELTTGGCTSKSSGTAIQVGGASCPDKRYWNVMSGHKMISLNADGFTTTSLPGSPIVRDEASAMISDRDGNMLLFTDGKNIYGADFAIISSGTNVLSGTSSNQGAMILQNPDPAKKNIYYIFAAPETWGGPPYSLGTYKFITVDLSQGNMYNGKTTGKVISGPTALNPALGTEKMVAISKNDGSGYFVVTHSTNSYAFVTYEITGNGLVNTSGNAVNGATLHQNVASENAGAMMLSPSGSMLAISYGASQKIEIYAFNRQTGTIGNLLRTISTSFLTDTQDQYYLQFSPDETKLYVNSYSSYTMYQYDLGTSSFNSFTFPFKVGGHLFILPNGKILGTDFFGSDYIINVPNATLNGNVCMVEPTDYITTISYCGISEVPILASNNVIYKIVGSDCIGTSSSGVNYALNYTPNPFDTFKWTIKQGIPPIASIAGADNGSNVNVNFSSTVGTIELQCTITGACGNTVISKTIKTSGIEPITGTFSFCAGSVSTLASTTVGGTWTSSNTAVATVVAATGVVTGVAPGTSTITYTATVNGCISTKTQVVTVKALPTVAAITGTFSVCSGKTTTLASTTTGGTWTSSNTAVATVVPSTGMVTGVAAGTSTITYSVTVNGCVGTKIQVVTVTASPTVAAITGTFSVCAGKTTTLASTTTGGTWTSSNTAVATVVSTTGVVTGVAAGTSTITYSYTSNGCTSTKTQVVTVNALPTVAAITGTFSVCSGKTTTLASTTTGGTWTSSNTAVATVAPATGLVTGVAAGTSTITYSVTVNGCVGTKTQVVTVTASPTVAAITGTFGVCVGNTTTLASTTTGGTWTSSNTAVATVVPTTGVVTGVAVGTSTITYSFTASGCTSTKTQVVTVTALPTVAAITGTFNVCPGLTATLANTSSGGVWTSSNTAVATISASGVVTGVAAGTTTIKYTVTANGCTSFASAIITVNPMPNLPSISGTTSACVGEKVTMTYNYGAGNSYFSYTKPVLLNIGGTGFQGGFVEWGDATASGNFVFTVQNASGCKRSVTSALTVNPLPPVSPITGNTTVCAGRTTALANATTGGTWTSSNTAIATVNTSGVVVGIATGTATITYTVTNGTCTSQATTLITVPSAPAGATFANPINITNNMSCGFTYSNTQNTATSCFVDNVGRPSPEIVYSFTLTTPQTVTFSTCQSGVADTWLTLMNSSMVTLATNDDFGVVCPSSAKASFTQANLTPGTYFIVAEGYSQYYTGSITLDVSVACNGLYFDGVDDYITIPIASVLPSNSTADAKFTVQITFNPDNTGSNAMYLLSFQNYSLNNYFSENARAGLFKQLDNKFSSSFFFPGIEGNTGIPSGTCTSLRITSPNTPGDRFYVGSFYINGALYSQPRTANPLSYLIERILIGTDLQSLQNPSAGTAYFKGSISEIRIWGDTPALNTVLTGNETGLLGYWKLNETSGQTILDYSPYGNHGYRGSTPNVDVNDPGFGPICPYVNNRGEDEASDATANYRPLDSFAPVVSPNPFNSETTLSFDDIPNTHSMVNIEVKDVQGKTVYTKEHHPISQSLSIGNNLAQGVYFVGVSGLESPYNFKIVKR